MQTLTKKSGVCAYIEGLDPNWLPVVMPQTMLGRLKFREIFYLSRGMWPARLYVKVQKASLEYRKSHHWVEGVFTWNVVCCSLFSYWMCTKGLSPSMPIPCVHISHIYCTPDSSVKVIYWSTELLGKYGRSSMDGRKLFSVMNRTSQHVFRNRF